MRLTPKSTQNLIRHAFRESRGFLALLLVGAPALYSVEAYFTTLTEALKAPGEINWFASTVFSLVFLTLNVRFINGNYDHIRSPQWADRNLGKTGFAFFIDVSAIILMHALLVVMATRTFLTAQGLPVGVTVSTTQDFYCPGFFSCVVLLLIVDVLWLSYKLMIEHVSRWLLNSGSGGVIKRIARGPLHFLSGAYAERNFMWWWINAVSLVSICVLWTLPRNIAGMNPNDSHVLQPWQQLISDQVHVSASNAWLVVLAVAAVLAAVIDINSTSVGPKAARQLELIAILQKLFERAREKGRAAQNIRVRDATVAIEFPLGWLVAIDDQEHVLFLPAHLATPPPDALVREFEQFLESHRADVLRAKDIVVFCMLKPKGSDVHAIKALLERVREQGSSVRAPFRAEVCWLKEFRQDVRRFSHPVIEGLTLTELSTFHLLADDDMARQFQACMEDLDAAGNELKLSNVWRDL